MTKEDGVGDETHPHDGVGKPVREGGGGGRRRQQNNTRRHDRQRREREWRAIDKRGIDEVPGHCREL